MTIRAVTPNQPSHHLMLFGFAELLQNDVPPPQRKVTFTRGLSSALGHPWLCPTFDTLWNGERL